jgi:hypothetical protein
VADVPDAASGPETSAAASAPPVLCSGPPHTDSYLQFTFEEPTDIDRIRILGGRYADDKTRPRYARPHEIELWVGDRCTPFRLRDEGTLQGLDFKAENVTKLDLRVVGFYPGDTSPDVVEIGEVLFERRR